MLEAINAASERLQQVSASNLRQRIKAEAEDIVGSITGQRLWSDDIEFYEDCLTAQVGVSQNSFRKRFKKKCKFGCSAMGIDHRFNNCFVQGCFEER